MKPLLKLWIFLLTIFFTVFIMLWNTMVVVRRFGPIHIMTTSSEVSYPGVVKSESVTNLSATQIDHNYSSLKSIFLESVIDLFVQFVRADSHETLETNFYNFFRILLPRTSAKLRLHISVDDYGQKRSFDILHKMKDDGFIEDVPLIAYYHVYNTSRKLSNITRPLQELFSRGASTYYGHAIFFIPAAIHHIMPASVSRLIMFDLDMQVRADINDLYSIFDRMNQSSIMGLAYEQQPVYQHLTWEYRDANKQSRIGSPPPDGLPGFNSGTKLLHLNAMRESLTYNKYLDRPDLLVQLANKYKFRGHLGDQDFFSLLSFEHPELFHVLPCQWNRQLCTWWQDHGGYTKVEFDKFHRCDGPIYVYHGNCNTPIPNV